MSLHPDARALIEGPNFAHLATLLPSGAPHSVPVWIDMEGDRVVFFAQRTSQKGRNVERDPRVALSIVAVDDPYRSARLSGVVVETIDGPDAKRVADRIAMSYRGRPFRKPTTTLFLIEVRSSGYTDLSSVR